MHHLKRTLLLSIAVITVCAAHAHGQTTLRFQFKEKEKLPYTIEQKTKATMNIAGAEVISNLVTNMVMDWEVVKIDDKGHAQVTVKVTHSKMSMESLLGMVNVDSKDKDAPGDQVGKMLFQVNKAFAAMEISAVMLPTGELKDVKVSEATSKALKALPGADQLGGDLGDPENFKDMLSSLIFPSGAVTKGKSWNHKTQAQFPEGKVSTDQVFTLEDTIEKDGVKLEKISLKPDIKIDADPKAVVKVKSIKSSGSALFDNKAGRFVEGINTQTKVGTIEVMGLTVDSTSVQTTTIRLKVLTAEEKSAASKAIKEIKIDDSEFVEKDVAKELLETIQGVSRSFSVERSFEPAIIGLDQVSADLKAKVEAATNVTLGKKTTVKESITLDGKDTTKVNVVWVERYRRATATLGDGSTMSFQVKVGLRFKLEKAK